ncbi:acetoacetate--CoA ligase [Georgenia yuyongxinii]|uniref:Acetoacetate--CoA ligase n=1 Tax=Georgenia yuyongxinii TaxID=2589797 RepID=A0A5B8C847_9MICO|nr:acetoacetate--CoA ligase [Georgenia yuyongxinii]QDC25631.1 acetoacetate--CoA ligase [Georgenia yuyongxinii]
MTISPVKDVAVDTGKVMWSPDPAEAAESNLARFMAATGFPGAAYDELHAWSVAEPGEFWSAVWEFTGVVGDRGATAFVRDQDAPMTGSRFFPDATLNLAENLLQGPADAVAVLQADETGAVTEVTRDELRIRVGRAQRMLAGLGVQPGDRVAGILPNTVDALTHTLAALSLGAIWTSCAPEFGVQGVLDRFGQVDPAVLVVSAGYVYNGRRHSLVDKGLKVGAALPGLRHVVILGGTSSASTTGTARVHGAADLTDELETAPQFRRLPFDHPAYIVYTSGTTGLPKSIVHRAGGVLLNTVKEHVLHGDVRPGDRMLYFTNTAWMMYHWSIAALACGASVVLYDGAAIPKDDPAVLFRLVQDTRATHFGTSPKYLATQDKLGIRPQDTFQLERLRMICSAGAPLTDDHFAYVYGAVKQDLILASISGGTEILGCFVLGNPLLPVRSGEIQCKGLGLAVATLDDRQVPVIGRPGDLVCTEPFPSMPLRFWGEDGWERYVGTYFATKPEVWYHGDLAEIRPHGGVVVSGRTDTTLKPGGVRIGTSEIYRVVETTPGVADSVVVGFPVEDDMEIWLFVVPEAGRSVDYAEVRHRLRTQASPRHVPARIFTVPAVPYNLAGKKVEAAVLQTLLGKEIKNRESLVDAGDLEHYRLEMLTEVVA